MSFEFPFNLIGKLTMAFLTGQSRHVLKSWYTGGGVEQGFQHCFADGLNKSLISSVVHPGPVWIACVQLPLPHSRGDGCTQAMVWKSEADCLPCCDRFFIRHFGSPLSSWLRISQFQFDWSFKSIFESLSACVYPSSTFSQQCPRIIEG